MDELGVCRDAAEERRDIHHGVGSSNEGSGGDEGADWGEGDMPHGVEEPPRERGEG